MKGVFIYVFIYSINMKTVFNTFNYLQIRFLIYTFINNAQIDP